MARHAARRATAGGSGGGAVPVLLGTLLLAFLGTCFGLGALWTTQRPDTAPVYKTDDVVFVQGTVYRVLPGCAQLGRTQDDDCDRIEVTLDEGRDRGDRVAVQIPSQLVAAGIRAGDVVELARLPVEGGPDAYSFNGVDRSLPLWILAGLVVAVVVAVARMRGLLALVGMVLGSTLLAVFALPALLTGRTGVGVGLTAGAAILSIVLPVAHGPRLRTLVALAGALTGMLVTALVAGLAVSGARLGGIGDQPGATLTAYAGGVRLSDVLVAAMVIASLGVLHDVAITQTNAVAAARRREPDLTVEELHQEAMRTGREHIAGTLHTILWAYLGTSLSVLAVLYLYDRSLLELLSTEDVAQQVVRMGASAIGLVLAVPATTRIAAHVLSHSTPVRQDA